MSAFTKYVERLDRCLAYRVGQDAGKVVADLPELFSEYVWSKEITDDSRVFIFTVKLPSSEIQFSRGDFIIHGGYDGYSDPSYTVVGADEFRKKFEQAEGIA